ncbi:MAG: hypothetical protein HOV81_45095 [Kofleriaceae bacterium]|nr:hypothetical protein [Kofleriaceae bacterium]
MTGKLIAFPQDAAPSDEPQTVTRARPQRASLASELRPLRRARTEREQGALAELPREATITALHETRDAVTVSRPAEPVTASRRELPAEPVTASRRDVPTMGERLRAGPAASPDSLRELIGEAAPLATDERTTRRPAIRVLVGGQVRFVGWV